MNEAKLKQALQGEGLLLVVLAFPFERKSKDVGREGVYESTVGEQRLKGGPSMNSSLPVNLERFLYSVQNVILS